jgi:hypothetical protein
MATVGLLFAEARWLKPKSLAPREAFLYGTTGCELMPLPVFQVLPSLFPDQFQPGGQDEGDWIDQFGFIRGAPAVNEGLPLGFFVSNHRPKSGAPSPVKFVGVNCSLCHTSKIKRFEGDPGLVVHGMGSISLDFIAWVDAFKSALLDEKRLTVGAVTETYESQFHRPLSLSEELMIRLWLAQTRKTLKATLPKYDAPFSCADLRNSELMPNGPSRTQPFRNLVRNIMDRPAMLDRGLCKFPVLYEQENQEWGQFDGSVRNRLTRSVLAAMAVGATIDNLVIPDISQNVSSAIEYTLTLRGPSFTEVFKDQGIKLDTRKLAKGRAVYMAHCDACHGHPDPATGKWVKGKHEGEVFPAEKLGTDSERVSFRYYDILANYLYDHFADENPLKPKREDIRPGPLGHIHGYISKPLDSAFSRAPYLHNASIPTMAELINLKPRPSLFYRGIMFMTRLMWG